jgi:SAM-dependent methyltransferase
LPRIARPRLTAATADRHWLYEHSVQNAGYETQFIDRVYRRAFGRRPRLLREDFCGTANLSCTWAHRRPDNEALGVDLHGPTLAWGRRHNVAPLGAAASRVTLIQDDVRNVHAPRADVLCATNFSWWVFKRRSELAAYFQNCRRSLRPDGMLLLDIYGGPEAQVAQQEARSCDGFVYVWEQVAFNPITHDYRCRIHYRFPDGSVRLNAFSYDWRLWSVPEVRDLLAEAGFSETVVYWEGTDRKGRPNGVFRPSERGDTAPAWVAYVLAFQREGARR